MFPPNAVRPNQRTAPFFNSDIWVGEVKRIRGKKQPLTAAGVHALRDEYTRTIAPARALAAETLKLERALSDLGNQACDQQPYSVTSHSSVWRCDLRWLAWTRVLSSCQTQ